MVTIRKRPTRRDEASIDRQEVGLGEGTDVRHRHPEQHLALPLGVADRPPPSLVLRSTDVPPELGPRVQELDDPPVEGIDPPAKPSELRRLGFSTVPRLALRHRDYPIDCDRPGPW